MGRNGKSCLVSTGGGGQGMRWGAGASPGTLCPCPPLPPAADPGPGPAFPPLPCWRLHRAPGLTWRELAVNCRGDSSPSARGEAGLVSVENWLLAGKRLFSDTPTPRQRAEGYFYPPGVGPQWFSWEQLALRPSLGPSGGTAGRGFSSSPRPRGGLSVCVPRWAGGTWAPHRGAEFPLSALPGAVGLQFPEAAEA